MTAGACAVLVAIADGCRGVAGEVGKGVVVWREQPVNTGTATIITRKCRRRIIVAIVEACRLPINYAHATFTPRLAHALCATMTR